MIEYKEELVTFIPSPLNNGEFIPKIAIGKEDIRPFQADDMSRVLDYHFITEKPPPDTLHGHLELELDDDATVSDDAPPKFPKRYFCLRGNFIFYFDIENVDPSYDQYGAKFNSEPLGVIPLERTAVEFPPGGRRAFREHAKTEARNGYEMMIRHVPRAGQSSAEGDNSSVVGSGAAQATKATKRRAPAYLVCESLGQRELWANAIRTRADLYQKPTKLRAAGTNALNNSGGDVIPEHGVGNKKSRSSASASSSPRRVGGEISVLAGVIESGEQKDIDEALQQFGSKTLFEEGGWVNEYFQSHDQFEGTELCLKLESWQTSIKKGLRGAVLEQYEYFVEASREMTIMGREVASLKDMGNKQVETFESMKRVNFDLDFGGGSTPAGIDGTDNTTEDETTRYSSDEDEHNTKSSSFERRRGEASASLSGARSKRGGSRKAVNAAIEIPEWLEDVVDEIEAFVKECRYTDATALLLKAKTEVTEIVNSNERLTEKKLSKKEFASMQRILLSIEDLTNRLCERLVEGLRRKNEALKQISKKERADPLTAMAPAVSPTALNDDSTALQLLVRLGRAQDAASAYATRRSLLLNECLHERPICNTTTSNNSDVIIYAAQLSHSFFNALSISVEGFLDLFSDAKEGLMIDDHSETSSINTGTSLKSIPASALAATCLWCDSELLKFASVFGSKVLGNLMLSPREGGSSNKITDKINKFEVVADLSHLKQQLRAAEEVGEYVAAGKLRKKIAIQEEEERNGNTDHRATAMQKSTDKDRNTAIDIATKCIDQALDFSSEFLNTIGLPLAPRLAEYLRTRLNGAEIDIAILLEDKWDHIIFDWKSVPTN